MQAKPVYSAINIACVILLLAFDIITKQMALQLDQIIPVAPGISLMLVLNYGVAFGMLSSFGETVQILSISIFVATLYYLHRYQLYKSYPILFWILLIAGGIGNSIDRLYFGYVIDFIDISLAGTHLFVCNVADIYLSFAVLVLIAQFCSKKSIG